MTTTQVRAIVDEQARKARLNADQLHHASTTLLDEAELSSSQLEALLAKGRAKRKAPEDDAFELGLKLALAEEVEASRASIRAALDGDTLTPAQKLKALDRERLCEQELQSRQVPTLEQALGVQPEALDRRKTSWSSDELLAADFPEPRWVVPDLLPIGLASLAGRPKLGKSWLALQLSIAVGTGGRFLDHALEAGPVLYLAFEDSARRLKSRLEILQVPRGAMVQFETSWLPFDGEGDAGLVDLQRYIADRKPRLVIVDTLARSFTRQVDWNDVGATTATLATLQSLALDGDLCILAVDHHKKPGALPDVIDDILGSTGKSAVVDTCWGLYRKRGERKATLRVTGRDIDEQELEIEFDGLTCCWQPSGDMRELAANEAEQEIARALAELKEGDAGLIADYLEKSRQAVARVLNRMEAQGRVRSRVQGNCRLFSTTVR